MIDSSPIFEAVVGFRVYQVEGTHGGDMNTSWLRKQDVASLALVSSSGDFKDCFSSGDVCFGER